MDNYENTLRSDKTAGMEKTGSPIDVKSALERAMGDLTFLEMMLQQFLEQIPGHLEEIKGALETGDSDVVQEKAHALKGAASNLSAVDVASTALHLEELGRSGELDKGLAALDLLKKEMERLSAYIAHPDWFNTGSH